MRSWLYILLISVLGHTLAFAQFIADSVEITEQKILSLPYSPDYSTGDTSLLSAAQFLNQVVSAQLQNTTPGGLTTLLHRGHAHRHIPVMWEGVNIQNVINGTYDISLIPQFLMGGLNFYNRQGQSSYGNNGISGALLMDQGPSLSRITCGVSTLQNYNVSGNVSRVYENWSLNIGVQSQYDKNIFSYDLLSSKRWRPSTEFKKTDWVIGSEYYMNERSHLSFRHWGQKSTRHIPVSIAAAPTEQIQEDENYRTQLAYHFQGDKARWLISATAMQEELNFYTTGVNSQSHLDIYSFRIERRNLPADFSIYTQHRTDKASPNFYSRTYHRRTWQIGGYKKIQWNKRIHSFINVRQDFVDQNIMPLSVSHNMFIHSHEVHLSYNYNLPGFNDLNWPVGGNENLKTETSFSAEYLYRDTMAFVFWEASIFGQMTDNWIQWLPGDLGFWTARNQQKVFSRGGELKLNYPFVLGKFRYTSGFSYALNIATIAEHETRENLRGRQLIFVPKHRYVADLALHYGPHSIKTDYTFTGRRYDLQDESSYLRSIHLFGVQYVRKFKKSTFQLRINNLTNRTYSLVRFYPMPGIHSDIIYQYVF